MSTVTDDVMWIDRTGWTWLLLRGADRVDLLNRLSTNDLTQVGVGKGLQTVLTSDKARIIDVLTLLNDTDRSLVLASPGMGANIIKWLRKYTITDDVKSADASTLVGMVEITGARAAEVVGSLTGVDVKMFSIADWTETSVNGQDVYIVRMPATVDLSYWLVGNPVIIRALKSALAGIAGLEEPLTESDVEYLRVMRGIGAIGHEWTDAYNPLEAGLLHLTSFTKGCYIGQEIIARLDSYNKVKQRVLGFVADDALQAGDVIIAEGADIGVITTVTRGRQSDKWYALGYIRGEHAHPGTTIEVRSARGGGEDADTSTKHVRAELRLLPMTEVPTEAMA